MLITRNRALIVSGIAALASLSIALFGGARAHAGSEAFRPIPAATNIGALGGASLFTPPAALQRLGSDLRPGVGQTHRLPGGYAWRQSDGSVCTLADGGSGSCFREFSEPVVLYLTGEIAANGALGENRVWGIAPNSVRDLTIVTTEGAHVPAPISRNSFSVTLPPGVGVVGEQVTLRNGTSFFSADPVSGTADGVPGPSTQISN
jgi:hypothetical protein